MSDFKEIFEDQLKFQEMVGEDITTQDFKNRMLYALIAEVVESGNETAWKNWKKNQVYNRDKFVNELADIQLFLINLCLSANCSAEEFLEIVRRKQQKNIERQKNGY